METDDYALDHIMPVSRGGTNDITNLGLTLYKANQMKGDLTVPELLNMCEKILLNYGYTVTKDNE